MLFLHNALYAPGMPCSPVSFVSEISFLFNFPLDALGIIYNGNFFGHATLKGVFDIMVEIEKLPSLPYFDSVLGFLDLAMRAKMELSN